MSLAMGYADKVRIIDDIVSKMSVDEKKIFLRKLIKDDMKLFFEAIWDEQKFLEKEAGVEGVCEFTSDKAWVDGEEVEMFGLEPNIAGKPSKEAENAYYLDEKISSKQGNDKFDGFLGYVNSSGNEEDRTDCEDLCFSNEDETVLEPDENIERRDNEIT